MVKRMDDYRGKKIAKAKKQLSAAHPKLVVTTRGASDQEVRTQIPRPGDPILGRSQILLSAQKPRKVVVEDLSLLDPPNVAQAYLVLGSLGLDLVIIDADGKPRRPRPEDARRLLLGHDEATPPDSYPVGSQIRVHLDSRPLPRTMPNLRYKRLAEAVATLRIRHPSIEIATSGDEEHFVVMQRPGPGEPISATTTVKLLAVLDPATATATIPNCATNPEASGGMSVQQCSDACDAAGLTSGVFICEGDASSVEAGCKAPGGDDGAREVSGHHPDTPAGANVPIETIVGIYAKPLPRPRGKG